MGHAILSFWQSTVGRFPFLPGNREAIHATSTQTEHRVGDHVADYSYLTEADLGEADAESSELISGRKVLSASREL